MTTTDKRIKIKQQKLKKLRKKAKQKKIEKTIKLLNKVVKKTGNNKSNLVKKLKISRGTLYNWLKKTSTPTSEIHREAIEKLAKKYGLK